MSNHYPEISASDILVVFGGSVVCIAILFGFGSTIYSEHTTRVQNQSYKRQCEEKGGSFIFDNEKRRYCIKNDATILLQPIE